MSQDSLMAPFMEPLLEFCKPMMDSFDVASRASLFIPPQVEQVIADAVNASGLGDGEIRYLAGLVLAYPLAFIMSNLPSPTLKHLWSGVWGVIIAQIVFGASWFHTCLSTVIAYSIILVAPRSQARLLVFAFMLGYLACSHIYRIYVDWMGWRLDFTSAQMMLCTKFTCIAFNIYDGTVGRADIDRQIAAAEKKGDTKTVNMLKDRIKRSCTSAPSPLVVFGYCFNFSSYLAGPAFELSEYVNATSGKFGDQKIRPKGRYLAGFISFLKGIICIVSWLLLSQHVNGNKLYTPDILALPTIHYLVYGWLCMLNNRLKYYFAWLVGEGSCQWCSFGYNGMTKDGYALWDGVNNIDVLGVEFGNSLRDYTNKWNKNTQSWLQRYVYERTGNSLVATYFVSAFWHGFYPGYYLFFLSVPLGTEVQREFFRKLRPRALKDKNLKLAYDIAGWICTSLFANYLATAFVALSLENSLSVWSRVYFSGHIVIVLCLVGIKFVPMPPKDDSKKKN